MQQPKRQAKVRVKLPFNFRRLQNDLPRGLVLDEEGYSVVVQFPADTMLDYLHERGYCEFTSKMLRASAQAFENKLNKFNDLAGYALESECVRYLEEELF